MRQLLIVKSPTSFNTPATPIDNGLASHGVNDLSGLKVGAISFFELGNSVSVHESAPTKNFAIALGRKNNQHPFIIPEVDINTLHVTKALPYKGHQFSVVFTMPTTIVGKEYTLRFYKKGVVPHERNSWTVSIVASTTTAATEATAFKKAMDSKISDKFNLTTSVSTAQITITGNNFEDWEVKVFDKVYALKTHIEDKCENNKRDGIRVPIAFIAGNRGTLPIYKDIAYVVDGMKDGKDWTKCKNNGGYEKEEGIPIPISIKFATEVEAQNFYDSWKTTFCKWLSKRFLFDQHIQLRFLPFLGDAINPRTGLKGYTGEWTDNDIYKFFNIKPEEQKVIEETMEKYK